MPFQFNILKYGKRGQIFPVLIAATVILVIAALISANLGKISIDRLYCINAADAGAIAWMADWNIGWQRAVPYQTAMAGIYLALQSFLNIPMHSNCYNARDKVASAARECNSMLSNAGIAVGDTYILAATGDAYYYAFLNAGIDDKAKEDGTDMPSSNSPAAWQEWINKKSAFNAWLTKISLNKPNWASIPSLTYKWGDGRKSVKVSCLSRNKLIKSVHVCLFGAYYDCCPPNCEVYLKGHGQMEVNFGVACGPPPAVKITVTRTHLAETAPPAFWQVFQPVTQDSRTEVQGYGICPNGVCPPEYEWPPALSKDIINQDEGQETE